MRILVDEEDFEWTLAWDVSCRVFSYTHHMVDKDMFQRWPVSMLRKLLPRHMEIIETIDLEFQQTIKRLSCRNHTKLENISIIERVDRYALPPRRRRASDAEIGLRRSVSLLKSDSESESEEEATSLVNMPRLCIIGSHTVNGVSAVQTKQLTEVIFKPFAELWPSKFCNITNGISPRRWLLQCNPGLADFIMEEMQQNDSWITNLNLLHHLQPKVNDATLRRQVMRIKQENKFRFANYLKKQQDVIVNTATIFDVQVKRIHEYKRQLLNCLHVITLYNRMKASQDYKSYPRTVFFGGKASPGYPMAKLIIKLIHCIAKVVNHDPLMNGRLQVVFINNYRVSVAERVIPAADLSEQIPCAGCEASGTGNMKMMINGAVTIGVPDGANIELFEEVGHNNCFVFGNTPAQVASLRLQGYNPKSYINANAELRLCVDQIGQGYFSPADPNLFKSIYDNLCGSDPFMVCADYADYIRAQAEVDLAYADEECWSRMVLSNIIAAGKFSSDRTIREYAHHVWGVDVSEIKLPPPSQAPLSSTLRFYAIG